MKLNVVNFSATESDNPDLMKFSATACYLDTPTDGTPEGGYADYKTIIASDSAKIDSLVGMGVNCYWAGGWFDDPSDSFKGHDPWFKIGVITAAVKEDNAVKVEGHLWKRDFADICDTISCAKDSLGCSVEVHFDGVNVNTVDKTQTGIGANFTGMAILYKEKAAFKSTDFMCSIKKEDNMTQDEIKAISDEVGKALDAKLNEFTKKQEERLSALETKLNEVPSEDETQADAQVDVPVSFSMDDVKKAVSEGISEAFAGAGRKTVPSGSDENRFDKDVMELAAEIDKDNSKSDNQKWAAKLALWDKHKNELA